MLYLNGEEMEWVAMGVLWEVVAFWGNELG